VAAQKDCGCSHIWVSKGGKFLSPLKQTTMKKLTSIEIQSLNGGGWQIN
jgi:hypothetical protein